MAEIDQRCSLRVDFDYIAPGRIDPCNDIVVGVTTEFIFDPPGLGRREFAQPTSLIEIRGFDENLARARHSAEPDRKATLTVLDQDFAFRPPSGQLTYLEKR